MIHRIRYVLCATAILAAAAPGAQAQPAGSGNAPWFGIDNVSRQCEPQRQGPAEFIRNAQVLGFRHDARDVTDPGSGAVVETTIRVPDMGAQITFYRTQERCQAAVAQRDAGERRALDRYR